MVESILAGMKIIKEYCRAVNLPSSEAAVIQMIRDYGFPARKLGGIWISDRELIIAWVRSYIAGEIAVVPSSTKRKKK